MGSNLVSNRFLINIYNVLLPFSGCKIVKKIVPFQNGVFLGCKIGIKLNRNHLNSFKSFSKQEGLTVMNL